MPKSIKCPKCGTKIILVDEEKKPESGGSFARMLFMVVCVLAVILLFWVALQQGV